MQKQAPHDHWEWGHGSKEWYAGLDVKDYIDEKSVEVIYHAGCLASSDAASGRGGREPQSRCC